MTLRSGYITEDIQKSIFRMLSAYTSSPFDSWQVIMGWPKEQIFEELSQPFMYVLEPQITSSYSQFGGGVSRKVWEIIIGAWDHRNDGGIEEVNIMCSQLINIFGNAQTAHTKTFTVTLGSTTYTSTTLKALGIRIRGIVGPRDLSSSSDIKEFRKEMTVTLIA